MIAILYGSLTAGTAGAACALFGFGPLLSLAVALAASSMGALATGLFIAANRNWIRESAPRVGIAAGLHDLYDSVLDEPLPAGLRRLLAGLDGAPAAA